MSQNQVKRIFFIKKNTSLHSFRSEVLLFLKLPEWVEHLKKSVPNFVLTYFFK